MLLSTPVVATQPLDEALVHLSVFRLMCLPAARAQVATLLHNGFGECVVYGSGGALRAAISKAAAEQLPPSASQEAADDEEKLPELLQEALTVVRAFASSHLERCVWCAHTFYACCSNNTLTRYYMQRPRKGGPISPAT